LNWI